MRARVATKKHIAAAGGEGTYAEILDNSGTRPTAVLRTFF
jgi:hypothetical protein